MTRRAIVALVLCLASCASSTTHHDAYVRGCRERGLSYLLPEEVRLYCECMVGKSLDDGRLNATVAACARPFRVAAARRACLQGCNDAPYCADYCACVVRASDVASNAEVDDARVRAAAVECSPRVE